MVSVKCNKCGAQIPEGAAFCPGCGAPKTDQNQTPPPPAQQTPPPPPPPVQPVKVKGSSGYDGFIDSMFSRMVIVIIVGVFIMIAWIARLVNMFVGGSIGQAMTIMNFTFMTGAGLMAAGGGFLNQKYNIYIRVGLIAAGSILIATNI